jgi:hypothetical protein
MRTAVLPWQVFAVIVLDQPPHHVGAHSFPAAHSELHTCSCCTGALLHPDTCDQAAPRSRACAVARAFSKMHTNSRWLRKISATAASRLTLPARICTRGSQKVVLPIAKPIEPSTVTAAVSHSPTFFRLSPRPRTMQPTRDRGPRRPQQPPFFCSLPADRAPRLSNCLARPCSSPARRKSRCTRHPTGPSAASWPRRGSAEMLIHPVKTIQRGSEIIRADRDHCRKANRRIHRVAAAGQRPLEFKGATALRLRIPLPPGFLKFHPSAFRCSAPYSIC